MNAWLERPPKFSCTSRRACTDSDPDASQPARERIPRVRERAEHERRNEPGERDGTNVIGGPTAQTPEWSDLEGGRLRRLRLAYGLSKTTSTAPPIDFGALEQKRAGQPPTTTNSH